MLQACGEIFYLLNDSSLGIFVKITFFVVFK